MVNIKMSDDNLDDDNDDTLLLEQTRPKLKKPPLYKVILLNDDFTPMEFVIHLLEKIFKKSGSDAETITWNIHEQGRGVCGTFSYEVAETKVQQANEVSRSSGHPLTAELEKL